MWHWISLVTTHSVNLDTNCKLLIQIYSMFKEMVIYLQFFLQPGDLLYFPRGTVYFPAPIEDKDHAVYLAITTFQEK